MKEKIMKLLNSGNIEDAKIGIVLSYKLSNNEFSKLFNHLLLDEKVDYPGNMYFQREGHVYFFGYRIIYSWGNIVPYSKPVNYTDLTPGL